MNCVLYNVDWCYVGTKLIFNWWLLIGMLILTPIFLYFKFRWKIRAWKLRKLNPKHIITAIFLNKEGCISILPMKTEEQKIFNFNEETYTVNKTAMFRKYKFKESITDICKRLDTFVKEHKLPEKNIITETTQQLREMESYSINEKGIFHTFHGKKWFWQKQSTGEPYSIYIDNIPTPINRDFLLKKVGVKWDSSVIYELAHQTFLRQFLTDTQKVNWKMLMYFMIALVIGGIILYQYKTTGKLI